MRTAVPCLLLACGLSSFSCAPATSGRSGSELAPVPAPVPTVELSPPAPELKSSDAGTGAEDASPDGGAAARDERPTSRSCRCDVLDFESDGPPKGRCTWVQNADGSGTLTGETSSPKFSATLAPIASRPGREADAVRYVFEGEFEFACKQAWCGRATLNVLQVQELDYRVTVARSADGPPSHVLWLTCTSP
jgi:hypothetical protein